VAARPKTVLHASRVPHLRARLDALVAGTDGSARIAADPLAFPRRYTDPRDREIAALYAGLLAFGRVELFGRVLDAWFSWLDVHGGPHAGTLAVDDADTRDIEALYYRWVRGPDLVVLMGATRRIIEQHGNLEGAFSPPGDLRARLTRGSDALRLRAVHASQDRGMRVASVSDLPRGLRHVLASPAGASACKRWHMILRWLVRPDDGVDLGLWRSFDPAELLIPVDTHVLRVANFVGLTRRPDASWRTAEEITRNLRRLDPHDPVRYDFALAHLGISGACRGERDAAICPACPLVEVCRVGGG
jgi:uncharacterized protein (TIGR02757 family)